MTTRRNIVEVFNILLDHLPEQYVEVELPITTKIKLYNVLQRSFEVKSVKYLRVSKYKIIFLDEQGEFVDSVKLDLAAIKFFVLNLHILILLLRRFLPDNMFDVVVLRLFSPQ